jgi:hypothetical protein
MMDRPDKFPDWALIDKVDDISKQNNVIEPPGIKKQEGWGYRDKGARNWFNWLARYTVNWLKYLDEQNNFVQNYSVATLPSATEQRPGSIAYVSDESGGAVMAFSDGTNWRRVTDRKIVS